MFLLPNLPLLVNCAFIRNACTSAFLVERECSLLHSAELRHYEQLHSIIKGIETTWYAPCCLVHITFYSHHHHTLMISLPKRMIIRNEMRTLRENVYIAGYRLAGNFGGRKFWRIWRAFAKIRHAKIILLYKVVVALSSSRQN